MIEKINTSNIKDFTLISLLDFISNKDDMDFYYTQNNVRIYIRDLKSLKIILKNSVYIYTLQDKGDHIGIILVLKSFGDNDKRYYVKVSALSMDVANRLLTVLLWNCEQNLFIKIRKDSKFLSIFKQKGFKFFGGRGCQLLLKRKKQKIVIKEKENVCNDS